MAKSRQQVGAADRACAVCKKSFTPYREYTVTCSRSCREAGVRRGLIDPGSRSVEFTCGRCGETATRTVSRLGGTPKFCAECIPLVRADAVARKNAARALETAKDPELRRRKNRESAVRRYGITLEQHDAMLAEQNGLCAICGAAPDPNGVRAASRLHIDHDHSSGQVRALLCLTCNQGIGYFRDDPVLLHAAAVYVWRWRGATDHEKKE